MRTLFHTALALLILVPAATAQRAAGTYVDISTGSSGIPLPGDVTAVAVGLDGSLYAAGEFVVGQQSYRVYSVARWTGSAWVEVGRASGGSFTRINALAIGPDGSLFVGGRFEAVGDVASRSVARWNGQQWQPVGGGLGLAGLNPEVFALAVDRGGAVYAGGEFYLSNEPRKDAIAYSNGDAWRRVDVGVTGTAYAIALTSDGTLYAGGRALRIAGTNESANVLVYTTQWKALGDGPDAPSADVRALLLGPGGTVYAGSDRSFGTGADSARVSLLTESTWSRFGRGLDAPVNALALDAAGRLVAGTGGTYGASGNDCCLSAWDGRAWVPFSGGTNSTVLALATSPPGAQGAARLVAGGLFSAAGDVPARSVAAWEGSAWRAFGSSADFSVSVVAYGPDGALYAGGSFSTIGSLKTRGIARWTGTRWEPLGSGVGGVGYVGALLFGPDGSLYAGGRFTSIGGIAARGIARWDGTAWHALGSGPSSAPDKDVQDMAFGPDGKLYVVGDFYPGNRTLFRWDGATWEAVGGGAAISNGGNSSYLTALAFGADGSLYVGGYFTTVGGVAARHIARWDGTAWTPLGGGLTRDASAGPPTGVLDLAVAPDGALLVGGSFLFAGGRPARNVARWDGAAWSAYATGLNQEVFAIDLRPDGGFVVGGRFTATGDGIPGQIALWDGTRFRPLPDGIRGSVYALASDASGALAIGGDFLATGDALSPFITRFDLTTIVADETAPPDADDAALSLSLAPNPARMAATATVTHPAGRATVELFDTLGRRVAGAFDGVATDETYAVRLDLGGLAPGLYVVRLTAGGTAVSRPLVVAR